MPIEDASDHSTVQPAKSHTDRRNFLCSTAAASTFAAMTVPSMVHSEEATKKQTINLGIVGCGGRGSGAINDSLSINEGIKLVAAADLYADKNERLKSTLTRRHPEKIALEENKMYTGLDGYKKVLEDPDVDVVLLTTSPGFRPYHILEAVEAGKHVFAEKPSCVDPAGYQICLKAHELAEKNGTSIVTGTQYRRQVNYVGAVDKIRSGMIGDIVSATSRYCSTGIWYKNRTEGMSDTEYQLNNWMHFIWLSGDQITEQAVHNIDTMNWVMGSAPISAYGSGGRFTRPDDSEMWDNMEIDYMYPGDRNLSFMCRQVPGTRGDNSNVIYGTEANCHIGAGSTGSRIVDRNGKELWSMKGSIADAYKQEHKDLIDAVRSNQPIVELKQTAESSLTAVMGRMAAYTGQLVSWDFASKESTLDLFPKELAWDGKRPAGEYAIPGKTKLV
ncbi:Gfo/Idh/MocA family protein [Rosistilla oblonga]|uniref:Inositol 2-dehydrogenase n=1 Tax=Rosistilla oblonga TaxID=2527990 RepID=A0A518IR80_9BACT|nr:Gfo/Idh/MocA family oxidoreductase [Rosistilla oblonga]QDV55598.1 Inositol 2-dehydrogenase [Rosistilla oblonga]